MTERGFWLKQIFRLALAILVTAVAVISGCGDGGDALSGADACERANVACPECYDGDYRCTLGEYEAVLGSCFGCQANVSLMQQICDDGNKLDAATLEQAQCEKIINTID